MKIISGPRLATTFALLSCLAGARRAVAQPSWQPYHFRPVRIVGGGFITGIEAHPLERDLFYARTDIGGAYRWDAASKGWISITSWVNPADWNLEGTASIALDPTDPIIVYLAQGTYVASWASNAAIFKSYDQGAHFKVINLPIQLGSNQDGRYSGERLAVVPWSPNVLYLGTNANGLWKSTNYAETWAQVASFPVQGSTSDGVGVIFVLFGPKLKGAQYPTIYAGVSDPAVGLYQSTDNGASWQAVAGQPTGVLPTNAAISPNGNLYLTYSQYPGPNSTNNGQVWAYMIAAGKWTNITPANAYNNAINYGFAKVVVDPNHPNTIVVGTMDRYYPGEEIYRSTSGGATWIALGAEPDTGKNYSSFDVSLSPWLLFGGTQPTNNMGNWIGAMAIDPFDSNHMFYGTGQTMYTTDELTNVDHGQVIPWTVGAWGIEETAVQALASPPVGTHLLSAVADIGAFRHDNFNVSPPQGQFYVPALWTNSSIDFAQNNGLLIARVGDPAYGATNCGGYSTDQGNTWTVFTNAPNCLNNPGTIAVAADGSRFVWATTGGQTFYSTDHGVSWIASTGAPASQPAVADRINPKKFYSFDQNAGTFYVSTDGGQTFTQTATGLPTGSLGQISASFGAEGDVWLSLKWNGLFRSTNSGATFTPVTSVQQGYSVGFGKAAPGAQYPAVFVFGYVDNFESVYRSDDNGGTWVRVCDDAHQYANISVVTGDPRVYGRVYIGDNGLGIHYGDILSAR